MVAQPCVLCELPAYHPVQAKDGLVYCCTSCREVAALLQEEPLPQQVETIPVGERQDVELSLSGLYCPSCAWLIEERLKRTPGVKQAQVNYIRREARLSFDSGRTNAKKLARRIRSLGYKASLPGEALDDEEDAFFTRLLVGGMLAMHIMITSLIIYVRGWMGLNGPETLWLENIFYLMQFVVVIPLLFVLGLPVLRAGIASLLRGLPNTHTLVTLGVTAAVALSSRNLFTASGHVYFDTAAMLLLLMTIGRWLEMKAHKSSREAVENLLEKIPPQVARVSPDGDEILALDDVQPGMRLRVLPGSLVPVDGVVARGMGDIDQSLLTGEPAPVFHKAGDRVWAGTLNLDGSLEILAQAVGSETRAGQISHLLHQALWQRSPVERLADKLAAWLIPAALVIASGTFIFWYSRVGIESALLNSLSVLLIACPCALGLATPLTLWQALARAARNGVVLRNTAVLEQLAGIQKVFFDKTGTLTQLPMQVVEVVATDGDIDEFLSRVVAVERHSEHPVARAIVRAVPDVLEKDVSDFKALPGRGVEARIEGLRIQIGSLAHLLDQGFSLPENLSVQSETLRARGHSLIYAGWDNEVRGLLAIGETIRPEVVGMFNELQALDKESALLTGDDLAAGERWALRLGIPVSAGLTPEEKLVRIQESGAAAMVGDGINDGPALAAAAVGIALANSTDVARSAAEVVLVRDDLRAVPWLFALAGFARRKVYQNLGWALIYNLVGVGLAVSGVLQPALAALAMVLSSLLVTQNALRLRKFPLLEETDGPAVVLNETSKLPEKMKTEGI
jgi:Cu2+-exporting ATPase